jgi:O-antigen/teichoic acid export membrane protein
MISNKIINIYKENNRSSKYKRNSILLIFSQIINVLVSLLLVPMTLGFLGIKEFGVWVTLTTIIGWFIFFDIGLGHGLRNKYAEAKAKNDLSDIKKYVSTAFFSLSLISLIIFLIFSIFSIFINWSFILNAPLSLAPDLKILALFVGGFFCLRFVLNIVNTLLTADQEPSVSSLIGVSGQLLSLGVVFLITKTTKSSILYIGIALSASQLLPLFLAFIYLFSTRYKAVLPSIANFSKTHLHSIFSLGVRFFLIQITWLVFFQSNNIIIAHVCGLEEVTKYNIAYKYFNILFILFLTFLTPLWSASTDAYTKGDYGWIKNSLRRLNQLWVLLILFGGLMILLSPIVYQLWLKNTIIPDPILMALLLLYNIFLMRSEMYRYFLNGVGKITMQFYITFLQSLIHIPLTIFLGKLYGLKGIVIVLITWAFINAIWEPIQYKRIINKTAKGIWNK